MPKGTKYGKQPFLDEIKGMGISYRRAATLLGVPYLHFRHAGYGYVVPKYELREALVRFLGKSEEDLFTQESLNGIPHYGDKGRQLMLAAQHDAAPETQLSDVL